MFSSLVAQPTKSRSAHVLVIPSVRVSVSPNQCGSLNEPRYFGFSLKCSSGTVDDAAYLRFLTWYLGVSRGLNICLGGQQGVKMSVDRSVCRPSSGPSHPLRNLPTTTSASHHDQESGPSLSFGAPLLVLNLIYHIVGCAFNTHMWVLL